VVPGFLGSLYTTAKYSLTQWHIKLTANELIYVLDGTYANRSRIKPAYAHLIDIKFCVCYKFRRNSTIFREPILKYLELIYILYSTFLFLARQTPVGHGSLVFESSSSHSVTPHSVELLWTNNQFDAQITFTGDRQSYFREIRTHNPSKLGTADPHLRPRSHWDRLHRIAVFQSPFPEMRGTG
jgi:hypothetical protein